MIHITNTVPPQEGYEQDKPVGMYTQVEADKKIDEESKRALAAEKLLEDTIKAEETRATFAETFISGALAQETEDARTAEKALDDKIIVEQERATGEEVALAGKIDSIASGITSMYFVVDDLPDLRITSGTFTEDATSIELDSNAYLSTDGALPTSTYVLRGVISKDIFVTQEATEVEISLRYASQVTGSTMWSAQLVYDGSVIATEQAAYSFYTGDPLFANVDTVVFSIRINNVRTNGGYLTMEKGKGFTLILSENHGGPPYPVPFRIFCAGYPYGLSFIRINPLPSPIKVSTIADGSILTKQLEYVLQDRINRHDMKQDAITDGSILTRQLENNLQNRLNTLDNKQDKLTAGTNITISNNVVSSAIESPKTVIEDIAKENYYPNSAAVVNYIAQTQAYSVPAFFDLYFDIANDSLTADGILPDVSNRLINFFGLGYTTKTYTYVNHAEYDFRKKGMVYCSFYMSGLVAGTVCEYDIQCTVENNQLINIHGLTTTANDNITTIIAQSIPYTLSNDIHLVDGVPFTVTLKMALKENYKTTSAYIISDRAKNRIPVYRINNGMQQAKDVYVNNRKTYLSDFLDLTSIELGFNRAVTSDTKVTLEMCAGVVTIAGVLAYTESIPTGGEFFFLYGSVPRKCTINSNRKLLLYTDTGAWVEADLMLDHNGKTNIHFYPKTPFPANKRIYINITYMALR